jgi:hypothetical protein
LAKVARIVEDTTPARGDIVKVCQCFHRQLGGTDVSCIT